ncbi:MAG: hypothetical protein J5I52_02630 [Saprospiraceae bacterium]|nr:MAG: hypothetical protein UZ09_BCD002001953 [Bacteroidetes bacterium OLB9]MCO6463025.1 hypothetical protein [Saprospiraceae bacterium]
MVKFILSFFVLVFIGLVQPVMGQDDELKPTEGPIILGGIGLGGNLPMADMKDRYGSNLNFSLGGEFINQSNWLTNGEFIYMYGNHVKEDVLLPFRTSTGVIMGDDEQIADIFMRERGWYLGAGTGRLFRITKKSRSGIKLLVSGGLLQHNIRFVDERNAVGQLRIGRHKGYDRLTRGFALKETIGYKHLSNDQRLNFDIAIDFIQGFTSEVRAYNFDTGLPTKSSRLDMMIGVRAVLYLAFYRRSSESVIYY